MSPLVLVAAGLVAAAFVALALARPTVALVTLVALDVSNINGVIATQIGTSPYRPQLALAAVAVLVLVRRGKFRFGWSPVLLGLLVLFAGFCLSFARAADPVTSQYLLNERARDLFYFLVIYALMVSLRRVKAVVQAAVLVLAALAGLTIVHEFVLGNVGDLYGLSSVPLTQEGGASTPRHAGTSADVNFWARLLILFIPLSLSLLAVSKGRQVVLWAGCGTALLVGTYLTQSRGGFLALFLALLVWAALAGGRPRRSLPFVPIALLVLVPLTGIGSRLGTLADITAGSTATADPSVVTRKRLQWDAWQMFLDAPFTGHGIGSYGSLFPRYDRLSNYDDPVDIVVAAHNFYLEQAADGGVFLLLAWAFFLGTVVFAALRVQTLAARSGDATARLLSVGVTAGVTGWVLASVFLHLSDFRALLLLAAVAAANDVQARSRAEAEPPPEPIAARRYRPALVAALMAVAVVSAGGVFAVLSVTFPRYSNSATLAVVPTGSEVSGSTAYQLDVVSRGLIVPTLAEVLQRSVTAADAQRRAARAGDSDVTVSTDVSRLGGGIVITVTADSQQAADQLGAAAVALSKDKISEIRPAYQLTGMMPGAERALSYRALMLLALAVALFLAATAAVFVGEPSTGPPRRVRENN